jgi:arylsulfatase A-like enzyme
MCLRGRVNLLAVTTADGWKLGEHGGWAKKTNFWNVRDLSWCSSWGAAGRTPRSPAFSRHAVQDARGLLLVSDPRQKAPGMRVDGTAVEYLDLYPTLAALALPGGVPTGLEGRSFAHLLDDAARPHRDLGFYQYHLRVISMVIGTLDS